MTLRIARHALVVAVAFGAAIALAPAGEPVCDRVVSVADLHGGYDAFVSILRETELVDEELRWAGGRGCLLQIGDVVDRGSESRRILDLVMALHRQAGGRVELVLGNHEVMDMVGDLRYVVRGEFEAFYDPKHVKERERKYEEFLESGFATGDAAQDLLTFDEWFPPGWFEHREAFSPRGRYGSWLLERPVMKIVNGTLYVHGGVNQALARKGVDDVNREVHREVRDHDRLRTFLVDAGMLHPLTPFMASFEVVRARLDETKASLQAGLNPDVSGAARDFLALNRGLFFRTDGPLWDRSLAVGDDRELAETVPGILETLGVSRIVVGHTVQEDFRIGSRMGGRVFLTDTGAGPAYGGRASALEIDWRGKVRAIYVGESEVLVDPPPSDKDIERFLSQGEVIESKEIGSGITRPKKVKLELEGRTLDAAFKTVDIHDMKGTRFEGQIMDLNFSDSYKNERASYLLDRWLGLGMVPPTVLRNLDGEAGALITWISDAIPEVDRRDKGLSPKDPRSLGWQRDAMYVFDALIANTDRNLNNQLITLHDWKLHLIDHSRSFRLNRDVSEAFLQNPTGISRSLLVRLDALDARTLRDLLGDLVSKAQIKALLARRDRIVEKVEADRKKYGDAMIIHDLQPPLEM